jgi:hypothetical protein
MVIRRLDAKSIPMQSTAPAANRPHFAGSGDAAGALAMVVAEKFVLMNEQAVLGLSRLLGWSSFFTSRACRAVGHHRV